MGRMVRARQQSQCAQLLRTGLFVIQRQISGKKNMMYDKNVQTYVFFSLIPLESLLLLLINPIIIMEMHLTDFPLLKN